MIASVIKKCSFTVHEMQCLVRVSLSHSTRVTVMKFQRIGTVTMKGYCCNPMPFRPAFCQNFNTVNIEHRVRNVGKPVTDSFLLNRLIALYNTVVTISVMPEN